MKVCTVDGCERPIQARGFCFPHYKLFRKSGELVPRGGLTYCSVDGCDVVAFTKGMCPRHYQQDLRASAPPTPKVAPEDLPTEGVRVCKDCGEEKPLVEFPPRDGCRDGRSPRCQPCHTAYYRSNRAARKDAIVASRKKWTEANYEYYLRQQREAAMRVRLADPEAFRERMRQQRAAEPEKFRERTRKWKAENPEKWKAMKFAAATRRRALKAGWSGLRFTTAQVLQRMAYWGNRCYMCGGPFDAVDHVKPLSRGGADALMNLRPVCGRHNSSKHARWYGVQWIADITGRLSPADPVPSPRVLRGTRAA